VDKMSQKSIIIIGAGLAGLSAGCYAQMNGYNAHIFEHHAVPGGLAATWKRKDYVIEGGIHFIMGHKSGTEFHKIFSELGTAQTNYFVDMKVYGRFIDEESGKTLVIGKDIDKLEKDLKAFSPEDSHIIDDLLASVRGLQGQDLSNAGMSKPPELTGIIDQLKDMWHMRGLLKYFTGRYAKSVVEYVKEIKDPFVRKAIEYLFLPSAPVWFISMILAMLAEGQMALLERGSFEFISPIEKRFKGLGGQITYKSTVEEIIVENNHAVGVKLKNGEEYRADYVVSACDGYNTIFNMLKGKYTDNEIKHRYDTWQVGGALIMVSYGVAREFPDEPPYSILNLQEPFYIGEQKIDGFMVRHYNYSKFFAPPGKSVVQIELEGDWDYWNNLRNQDKTKYFDEKKRIASEVLKRLENIYPGISSKVEVTDVATPYTTWRYTFNHKGSYMGWLLTPELIMVQTKRTLPGLKTFYMAGQWAVSAGGVPTAIYSGRHAIQIICHNDKKDFITSLPT